MDDSVHQILRDDWREKIARDNLLKEVAGWSTSKVGTVWELRKNKALLNIVHQNEELERLLSQTKATLCEKEAESRCFQELVKKNDGAQEQASLLLQKNQLIKSAVLKRASTILGFKQLNRSMSAWCRYCTNSKRKKAILRSESIWNQRMLQKWFAILVDGIAVVKEKRKLLQRCVLHRQKRMLHDSISSWKYVTVGESKLSILFRMVTRIRTERLLRRFNTLWRTASNNALYLKKLEKKSGLIYTRHQVTKVWKRWLHLTEEAGNKEWLAIEKRKRTILAKWKLYSEYSVQKAKQLYVSSKNREILLTNISFNHWLEQTKKKHTLSERQSEFSHRKLCRLKRKCMQHWFHVTAKNKAKRDFRVTLKSKKERHMKKIVFGHMAEKRAQKDQINKFILQLSQRRGYSALHAWWHYVSRKVKSEHWAWSKQKQRDCQTLKKSIFSWILYCEMSRTDAALRNLHGLEEKLKISQGEIEESKKLRAEVDKIQSIVYKNRIVSCEVVDYNCPYFLEVGLQWTKIDQEDGCKPSRRAGHSSVLISSTDNSSYIAVYGGYDGHQAFNDITLFNTDLQKWMVPIITVETGSKFPRPTWNHTACAFQNKMIVFGGFDGHSQSSQLSILSMSDNGCGWSQPKQTAGAQPSPLSQHSSCLYQDGRYMVVFGGFSTVIGHLNEVWILDLHIMSWAAPECFGTPPSKRRGHGATVVNNRLYIFGGFDGTAHFNDIHVLDLQNMTWDCLKATGQIPTPRRHHALVAVGECLVVYGGYDGETYLEDVHSFDINKNMWRTWDVLKPGLNPVDGIGGGGTKFGRSLHTMTLQRNQLIVFGGAYETGCLEDVMFLDNVYAAKGRILQRRLSEEGSKNLSLESKMQSYGGLLENHSRELVSITNRAIKLEQAYRNEQKERKSLIEKNSILRRKLEKYRRKLEDDAYEINSK